MSLIKYIVLVTLTCTPTPCDRLPISYANYLVHSSTFYFLECLVRCRYFIASPVSSSMISSVYLAGVVCAVVSIFIATSKILRRLSYAGITTWFFGATCVVNSSASELVLEVRNMHKLCWTDTGSGLSIRGISHFLGIVVIGIVDGSTLGYGVGFEVKLA